MTPLQLAEKMLTLRKMGAEPGWDDESGDAIAAEDVEDAFLIALRVHNHLPEAGLPEPGICGDGSIHLTWRLGPGARVTLERKGGENAYTWRRTNGRFEDGAVRNTDIVSLMMRFITEAAPPPDGKVPPVGED
jgi:hypothetical protein